MAKFQRRKNVNISRVVTKIAITLIALWAGGYVLYAIGDVLACTASPFYKGLSLIGWTVASPTDVGTTCATCGTCNATLVAQYPGQTTVNNVVTSTAGSGILAVIGIIGLASIVMEFVEIKM